MLTRNICHFECFIFILIIKQTLVILQMYFYDKNFQKNYIFISFSPLG